jgi:hypothetical protein
VALRDETWGAPSDARGAGSVPGDAAVQKKAQAVVVEAAESVTDALDLFDEQVRRFGTRGGRPAGGVPGQDRRLPAAHRASQPSGFPKAGVGRPAVEVGQRFAGLGEAAGGVDVAKGLLSVNRPSRWGRWCLRSC